MKITLNSSILLNKLQLLEGVINRSNTLPILDNFLFDVKNNELKITASDLETTMSTTIEVESSGDIFIALPAKMLVDILKTFPEQPLGFEVLKNNTIEISSNSGKYNIAYAAGDEFPKGLALKDPCTTLIPAKVLATAISKTIFATGNDDLRPVMCGVLFQLSTTGLTFVATDTHKLVKYSRNDLTALQDSQFIMPKKTLNVLKGVLVGLDDEVKIEYNESNATFTFENYVLSCRLIDGKYPNYEAVIPKDNPNKLLIDRIQFLNSLKCVSIFSSKVTHQVALKVGGMELKISAEDIDYSNKADETLICNYQGNDMTIGFNSKFLIEMLNNLNCNEIEFEMSQPNRAGIIMPNDGTAQGEIITMLIMPSLIK
jgi:DNA polymerase III subunit beta